MKPFLSDEEIKECPPTIALGRVMAKVGDHVVRIYGSVGIPRGAVFKIDEIVGEDAYMYPLEGNGAHGGMTNRRCLFLNRFAIYKHESEHEPL